jgi:hypothetical protein
MADDKMMGRVLALENLHINKYKLLKKYMCSCAVRNQIKSSNSSAVNRQNREPNAAFCYYLFTGLVIFLTKQKKENR